MNSTGETSGKRDTVKDTDGELIDFPSLRAYTEMQEELRRKYLGQWIIFNGSQLAGGGYDSPQSAYAAAREMGIDPMHRDCLIMRIVRADSSFLPYGG